jgi:predicted ribosome quality control (RQC) complex YloA/Tae2 family protein
MKLRKHLENKLILDIVQVNHDRLIDIYFGYSEVQYHLIIEFYASGNFIFTDENYKILALSHTHVYSESCETPEIHVQVNETYPLHKSAVSMSAYDISIDNFMEWYKNFQDSEKDKYSVKKIILASPLAIFGKEYIEHILLTLHIDQKSKLDDLQMGQTSDIINNIKENYTKSLSDQKGYIVDQTYCPILYEQYKNKEMLTFDIFSQAVEKYYESIKEVPKSQQKKEKKEINKEQQKILNITNQIKKMEEKINLNLLKINIIEENVLNVDMIIKIISTYTGDFLNKMLDDLNIILEADNLDFSVKINYETTSRLNIVKKTILLKYIPDNYVYMCDYDTSGYDIITNLYSENKKILQKIESTRVLLQQSNKKQVHKNNTEQVNMFPDKPIKIIRKQLWYEQFHWCFSSEGYLIIVGKNADQNETIVKKYMEKNDLYLHSDVFGSGSGLIKRTSENTQLPIITIEEAGAFLICHTKAWNSSPDKPYWVYSNQVSKTTEAGEYVTKGSFIIRGQKNYLSLPKLELGITIMFKNKNEDVLTSHITNSTEFAIPMCAPYRTVNKNKFKIKIVHGTGKITKTLKNTIIGSFNKQANNRELPFLKSIDFDDFQKVMICNIKCL